MPGDFLREPETEPRSERRSCERSEWWLLRLRRREPDARGRKGNVDGLGVLEERERSEPRDLCERIECCEASERW